MKNLIERLRELAERLAAKLGVAAGAAAAALALSLAAPASAQVAQSIPLLSDGVLSITVSNTIPYTNLFSVNAYGTNLVGLMWTNAYGSNIVAVGTNYENTKLTRSASMWADLNGTVPTNADFSCTFICGAGNNGTTNLIQFAPVYDGVNETTEPADYFNWALLSAGATVQTQHTNIFPRWPGAQKIRVRVIASGTNSANSQFTVLDLRLNAFPR
jgi:hypothetical protein